MSEDMMFNFTPYIPQTEDAELVNYKPRGKYMKLLDMLHKIKENTLITGEAGTGKTSIIRYLAMQKKIPFFAISCDFGLNARELFGGIHLRAGETIYKEGLLTKFCSQPSIILFDEVNSLDNSKSFILHQLFSERRFFVKEADGEGKMYDVHPDVWFVAAGNPPTGKYTGTNRYNAAFINRFSVVEIEEFNKKELLEIFDGHTQKEQLVQFYHEINKVIKKEGWRATFSIRDLKRIAKFLADGLDAETSVQLGFASGLKLLTDQNGYNVAMGLAASILPVKPEETGKGVEAKAVDGIEPEYASMIEKWQKATTGGRK